VLKRPLVIAAALVALLVVAGFAFLATWNIPAPSTRIEKVVPNDRLPR
jgi:small neutral amino acid transporter SnatA (MarC family)